MVTTLREDFERNTFAQLGGRPNFKLGHWLQRSRFNYVIKSAPTVLGRGLIGGGECLDLSGRFFVRDRCSLHCFVDFYKEVMGIQEFVHLHQVGYVRMVGVTKNVVSSIELESKPFQHILRFP